MSATELQLRTSAFGGFQKQDVLSYTVSYTHLTLPTIRLV